MNNNNNQQYPVQPNGMPYSKDDFLSLSNEYQQERKKLTNKHNGFGCVFVLLGLVFVGTFFPVLIGMHNTPLAIILAIVGIACMVIGGLSKPKGDRKLQELQEKYYADYIRHFNNKH